MIKATNYIHLKYSLLMLFCCFSVHTYADVSEIKTNSVHTINYPAWLNRSMIDRVADKMQNKLEWSIRRVELVWHKDQTEFENFHHMGPLVLALAKKSDSSIHIGPKVNEKNFENVFGHELVHIISQQKYKDAIPGWLEEGLANHYSHSNKVDYIWLKSQYHNQDIRSLNHPFGENNQNTNDQVNFHYMASQAFMEMIEKKCDLSNLIRLSVKRKLEDKLNTLCGVGDLNKAFSEWVHSH